MKNWKTDLLVLLVVGGILSVMGFVFYRIGYKDAKGTVPCEVADTYGYHNYSDTQASITCPDKRQELIIERKGGLMGSFEYRCHCQ